MNGVIERVAAPWSQGRSPEEDQPELVGPMSQNCGGREGSHLSHDSIFIEHLLCDKSCSRCSGYKWNTMDTGSCPWGASRAGVRRQCKYEVPRGRSLHLSIIPKDVQGNKIPHARQHGRIKKKNFFFKEMNGEGNGSPLQHTCLGNPMDRGAW